MNARVEERPLQVAIREVAIKAASPLAARRLADALPAALERALARLSAPAPPRGVLRQRPADRVAAQVAGTVAANLKAQP
jgi:hypothetical protein